MGFKDAVVGGAMAGLGGLVVVLAIIEILFYLALLVVVFGGAYFMLDHFGILMAGVLA